MVGKKGHFLRNYKKEAMMEERFTLIEKENRLLLEKMTNIMKYGSNQYPRPFSQ